MIDKVTAGILLFSLSGILISLLAIIIITGAQIGVEAIKKRFNQKR